MQRTGQVDKSVETPSCWIAIRPRRSRADPKRQFLVTLRRTVDSEFAQVEQRYRTLEKVGIPTLSNESQADCPV